MPFKVFFTPRIAKTKKQNKFKLFLLFLRQVIKNKPRLFLICSTLAVIIALINYNIGVVFKEAFIRNEGTGTIFDKNYKFAFNFFGLKLFKNDTLPLFKNEKVIFGFIPRVLLLVFIVKSIFSLLHFYFNNYAYDAIERDLHKDVFSQFIRAEYVNSSKVSRNLSVQLGNLKVISDNIWFIANRLIYLITIIFLHVRFDFNFGNNGKVNKQFIGILFGLFSFLFIVGYFLFKKAARLNIEAKKREEENDKIILERINNLKYIKSVSGEKTEEKNINKKVNDTFRQNKKSMLWSVLFRAVPSYIIIPSIPIVFVSLTAAFSSYERGQEIFLLASFAGYYMTAQKLTQVISQVVESLLNIDILSSSLIATNETMKTLKKPSLNNSKNKLTLFKNDNIIFKKVVFFYPERPQQKILEDFSFSFEKGEKYGIIGKNGIGKSTLTSIILKLYSSKEGKILIGKNDIKKIDTVSLHKRICHQNNRPSIFNLSIAENVFYPEKYDEKYKSKLELAAKKAGIKDFINDNLPQKFGTILREGGSDLSEGQKQQIAAMKIFIRDYDIYLLDEILSNVKLELKISILNNIFEKIEKNGTVIVIDHHHEIFEYVNQIYEFTGKGLIKIEKNKKNV